MDGAGGRPDGKGRGIGGPEREEAGVRCDMDSTADVAWASGEAGGAVLRVLLGASAEGLAILDGHGRFVLVNPAAEHILGLPAQRLLGTEAPFGIGVSGTLRHLAWTASDGRRRTLEYRLGSVPWHGYAVWFRDVTESLRQRERLTAIVRAASSVADACSLRTTLDAVAREIVMTGNIAAVQILAIEDPQDDVRVLGMAGFGEAHDFIERLDACRRRGAKVYFLDAYQGSEPIVVPHRKSMIMADPAWEPLRAIMDGPDWDGFVSLPMIIRGRTLGVINAYYVPGDGPGADSLAFLQAMADHAAVAIDTAALLTRARSHERRRLARDLHDSVVQQLFSMRMQAKALRAQLDHAAAGPDGVRDSVEELAELSQSALDDLRGLVFELRPLELADRQLAEAVRAHAAALQARTGLTVEVRTGGTGSDLAVDTEEDVYRIVQEALHNVVKHARATKAVVRLDRTGDGGLDVEVTDDGCGAGRVPEDPAAGQEDRGTLGLVSMRERAERWGGYLTAGPGTAAGWTVRVRLPGSGTAEEGSR